MVLKNDQAAIGIDLGGTSIKYALVSIDGRIYKESQKSIDNQAKSSEIIADIEIAINEMKEYAGNNGLQIAAVGVGTPGSVDVERGLLMGSTPNFRYWKNIHIADELQSKVKLPVFVDNDANLMALGESRYGAGVGARDVICITVGTGIGGGIIIDGKLYRGSGFAGGELGHMTIIVDGLSCKCGGNGCLEQYASASAMIRQYKKYCRENNVIYDENNVNVKYIFDLYNKGDHIAKKALEECTYFLARGLTNFINIFNPELIIIGGGVAEAGDVFIDMINEITFKYAMEKTRENVKIIAAKLGNKAGFLGAVSLAFECLNDK